MWLAAALVGGTAVAQAHVTGVTIAPATLSGPIACPVQQIFVGQITSTVAGKVGFQWTTSDGQHSPLQQAIFDSPSVKPVSYLWMALSKKPHIDGWVRLETKTPNRKTALVRVSVSCRH
jgi:hypothetical protein